MDEGELMDEKKIGKRRSNQRTQIQLAIEEAGKPLTVSEIHELAQINAPNLGIATVYRAIKLLLEEELIRTVSLPDSEIRYEPFETEHHHHFQCNDCQLVFDLPLCPISIPEGTTFPNGFRVDSHEITLYGSCPSCNAA